MAPAPTLQTHSHAPDRARSGRTRGRVAPWRSGALLMQSTGVNCARSGWRGPGSRTGDPGCPGYRTGRPEKAGEGTRAQNRANKKPWDHTSATTEKLGQYAADRHGQRRFSLPLTPKYHDPKGYFFPLSNYSFESSFR